MVGVGVWLLLAPYTEQQRAVGAIFSITVVLWATNAFPVGISALAGMVLLALFAGVGENRAFAGLGDPVIPLFIGGLILAKAMEVTGLSNRIAISILCKSFPTKSGGNLLLTLAALTACASLFLSNTATVAMLFPVVLGILTTLKIDRPGHAYAIAAMLCLSFAANISVGTPVGTPPDLIALGQIQQSAHIDITFAAWMAFGMPVTIIMLLVVWVVLKWFSRGEDPEMTDVRSQCLAQRDKLGTISVAERTTLIVLAMAIALWLAPTIAELTLKHTAPEFVDWISTHLTANVAGVLASLLLFAIPVRGAEGGHAITWRDAAKIDWGIVLLLAGGLSLGTALFESGLARELGQSLADATGANTLWSITALGLGLSILVSQFASNTATATAVMPVMVGVAQSAHVNPIAPAIGVALGASLGFAMPFSTATNAIVFTSGLVPQGQMVKSALIIEAIGFLVILGILRLTLPMLGLA